MPKDAEQLAEMREIKRRNAAAAHGNLRRWETTRDPYQRWWLERHTYHDILKLAAYAPEPAPPLPRLINGDGIHIHPGVQ